MRKMFVITCSLVSCCGLLTSKSLAREEIGKIARYVAGTEDSTGDRAKKLVKWMNENFEWTLTYYKQRTVEEIIQRRGVPTTSGRYPGKPVQASGTHDYQAMVEYSIQAELLGMQGEIQGSEYVCFVNRMGSELGRLYCFFPLRKAKLVSQDCSIESIKAPIMPEYLSDGRFFRLSLKSPIGIGQKQRLKIEFSGIIPPDEEYAAGAVSGKFWHPMLFALAHVCHLRS